MSIQDIKKNNKDSQNELVELSTTVINICSDLKKIKKQLTVMEEELMQRLLVLDTIQNTKRKTEILKIQKMHSIIDLLKEKLSNT